MLSREENVVSINSHLLAEQARAISIALGRTLEEMSKLKFGRRWMKGFLHRFGFGKSRKHGEAARWTPEQVQGVRPPLMTEIAKYAPEDVFNMDESGLLWRMPPSTTIAALNRQQHGSKGDQDRFTIAFACNATGTGKLPPLFIGHFKKSNSFGKNTDAWELGFVCVDQNCMDEVSSMLHISA